MDEQFSDSDEEFNDSDIGQNDPVEPPRRNSSRNDSRLRPVSLYHERQPPPGPREYDYGVKDEDERERRLPRHESNDSTQNNAFLGTLSRGPVNFGNMSRAFDQIGSQPWKSSRKQASISRTISRDNTCGESARQANLLAEFARKRGFGVGVGVIEGVAEGEAGVMVQVATMLQAMVRIIEAILGATSGDRHPYRFLPLPCSTIIDYQ